MRPKSPNIDIRASGFELVSGGDSGPSEYKFIALGPELIHQLRLLNLEVHNHFAGIGARKETNKRFTRVLDPVMDSFL